MTPEELGSFYRGYIACLNAQDWDHLGRFVHLEANYNGGRIGLSGYRSMLENDFLSIPDLFFNIDFMVCEPPRIASRLLFDCTPAGDLFGLPVNGRRVSFSENVFYEIADGRIHDVRSLIDKAAIASQIAP